MQIKVDSPELQTLIFIILFSIPLLLSLRKNKESLTLSPAVSNELKGLAILAVIFSHIGYFLSTNNQFLFPLSIGAGVGVNLFLFLSGFGLTLSFLKKPLNILGFYRKRLLRIFLPLWIILILLIIADKFLLGRNYSDQVLLQSFLGWFPRANLFADIDSPLWYFSFILFYYLTFPLFFWKKFPFLAPFLILGATKILLSLNIPADQGVLGLYNLHILAFPLGITFALVLDKLNLQKLEKFKYLFLGLLILGTVYTLFNSGVGQDKFSEQGISLITVFCFIFIFLLKNIRFQLLDLFGKYSYEIYLFHWPLLYRYDSIYKIFPPGVATFIYLGVFLMLGIFLAKLTNLLSKKWL